MKKIIFQKVFLSQKNSMFGKKISKDNFEQTGFVRSCSHQSFWFEILRREWLNSFHFFFLVFILPINDTDHLVWQFNSQSGYHIFNESKISNFSNFSDKSLLFRIPFFGFLIEKIFSFYLILILISWKKCLSIPKLSKSTKLPQSTHFGAKHLLFLSKTSRDTLLLQSQQKSMIAISHYNKSSPFFTNFNLISNKIKKTR